MKNRVLSGAKTTPCLRGVDVQYVPRFGDNPQKKWIALFLFSDRNDSRLLMKSRKVETTLAALVAALGLAGCAQQQQYANHKAAAPTPAPAKAAAPAARTDGYGPFYNTYESDGLKYTKSSIAFPSGKLEGSGLLLEKIVPSEAMVGSPFTYRYEVKNLTPYPLHQVMVTDRISQNLTVSGADPKPTTVNGGLATWNLGELEGNATKVITVTGSASEEGTVSTCGWATYSPILCEPIHILKAALQLVKTLTPEATTCDPVNMTLTVRNSGSSTLHDVTVIDDLPSGLAAADGKTSLNVAVGTLKPGESKEIPVALKAGRTGKFENMAKATSREGVTAQAKASTTIRQALLQLSCTAPAERYFGRSSDFCFKITNSGDAPAKDATIEASVPAGVTVKSTTGGGAAAAGKIVWRLGTLGVGESKEVCATVVSSTAGQVTLNATGNAGCAAAVTSSCQTSYRGIAAVLIEVVDVNDPIDVGANEVYEIIVTNQGTAPLTNVKLVSKLESSQEFVSGTGETAVSANGSVINYGTVVSIAPKAKVSWKVTVKALKAGDVRFDTILNSDQTERPVEETESTHQY